MRRIIAILAGLLLLSISIGGVSQLFAQPESDPSQVTSVLQVVDSEPLIGQELPLDGDVTIYFDRRLNCSTVPDAFQVIPTINGQIQCEGMSITFTPDAAFQRAQTYTFQLGTELRGADGAQLLDTYDLRLNTIGFLAVSETFPTRDATDVTPDTQLTIIFNRPIVPLVIQEERDRLPQPLEIMPAVEGTGEWINTSIYQFTPDESFYGGIEYTVRIPEGLTAADGAVLPDDFVLNFQTEPPRATPVSPVEGRPALNTSLQMTFNQPMDRASVEANFYLLNVDSGNRVAGTFEWADDDQGFQFKPDGLLGLDTTYRPVLNASAQTRYGVPLNDGVTSWEFTTVPEPDVMNTDPMDGENDVPYYQGIRFYFESPMNASTVEDRIVIEPEPPVEPDMNYGDYNDSYNLNWSLEPDTTYTVTLEAGAEDVYGNRIEEPYTFSFTTNSYPPELRLNTPDWIGFYNAERDPTQVFVSYRNIDTLNLRLYDLPLDRYLAILQQNRSTFFDLPPDDLLLRSWQIQEDVPRNALRFDLLEFSSRPGQDSTDCPAALSTRLAVGDVAVVISEPDPVRARASVPDGEIVELLYRDYALPVVDGPQCDDGIRWWQVRLRDDTLAWVAESVDDEYLLGVQNEDSPTAVPVEVAEGAGGLPTGLYYLYAEALKAGEERHVMVVANVNVAIKNTVDSAVVWVTDVQTGEPIADVPVTLYDAGEVAQGTTDADGLLRVSLPRQESVIRDLVAVVDSGDVFGIGASSMTAGIEPYQFGQSYDFDPAEYRVYMYTDRPVYRPGQPVYFRGIVRSRDDVRYLPPERATVPVRIYDDEGQIIYEQDLPLTEFGSFTGEITLAEDAGLGNYQVSAELDENDGSYYYGEGGSISFAVAEYRLPEFQVDVMPQEDEVVQGETVRVTVDSTYFFGGAVSNAEVDYSVMTQDYFFQYEGAGNYDFVDSNRDAGPSEFYESTDNGIVADGTAMTDDAGEFVIEVPADIMDARTSQEFTVEAVVTDESNQAVAGRAAVVVHRGLVYVGVQPEQYVGRVGDETTLNIITVDWDSAGVADQDVQVEIVERRWSSVQEQDARGRTTWTWEVEEIPVESGSVTTGDEGEAAYTFIPPAGGIYKITVTTRDSEGNQVVSSTNMWVSSRQYVSWRQQNSNRIDLVADRDNYDIGDTAEILITSPFQGTSEALITVERGDVLMTDRVTMDSNSFIYELPITEEHAPNIFVSAMIVKGVDENNPVAGFRVGYIELGVEVDRKVLDINISSNTDRAQPQETVTYTVETRDYAGNPVPAELGISVTDLAALSLAEDRSRPILNFFYGDQALSVRTSSSLTINTDQLTQEILDTIKGGGGGLAVDGVIEIRGEFIDTPYWNGALRTGDDGRATFDVRLPDNLTTWRLNARAVSLAPDGNMLVGQETFDLLSTKPILIRPVTPRFFVVGDAVILAAVVNNNTDSAQEVVVSLDASGVALNSDVSQVVTVPAQGRARVTWDVIVRDVDRVQATFTADAGNFTDGSISPVSMDDDGNLPVYSYEVKETVGTAGTLSTVDSRVESIVLPRRYEVETGDLVVEVDQSLAASTIDGLDYLQNYPHQCIEQTVSRFLPNIMTYRAFNQLGLAADDLKANLDSAVNFGLQKLLAEQKADGGWGWFVQDESNPLTTAYALIGLVEAREQGYPVADAVISGAQDFLRDNISLANGDASGWRLNRQAFLLYALARSGSPDVGRTTSLYENRDALSLYAKAYLADTIYFIDETDTNRINAVVDDIMEDAIFSAAGVHWEEDERDFRNWNTDLRTTALILDMLTKTRPDSDLLPMAVRYLMVQRRADSWETTQETAWSVMALTNWMEVSGELEPDYEYSVTLNDETLLTGSASPATVRERETLRVEVGELLQDEVNRLVFSRTGSNDGALYYSAYLRVSLPVAEVEALDSGIIVERRYYRDGDESRQAVTEGTVGDVIQVRLTIIAPNDLHYVVVEDPLPAGAEAINPDLETSQQIGTRPDLDNASPLRYGWGWWYFGNIEFRDEKVQLYSTYLPAGTYEYRYAMRLGVEGTYNVIPPTAEEFYFPDVHGRGAGSTFTVLPEGS